MSKPTATRSDKGVVPEPVYASPAEIPAQPTDALTPDFVTMFDGGFDGGFGGKHVPFWRPGAADIARGMGWKWLIVLPAALFVVGAPVAAIMFFSRARANEFAAHLIKLWVFALGVVITVVLGSVRRVVGNRKDDFCIHCGYSISGLSDTGTCPECGRPFVRKVIAEYRKDPHFFAHRYRKLKSHPVSEGLTAGVGPTARDETE